MAPLCPLSVSDLLSCLPLLLSKILMITLGLPGETRTTGLCQGQLTSNLDSPLPCDLTHL